MRRISGLDDVARIFFPDNRNHRRAFVAIWLEIKYADEQFPPDMTGLLSQYQLSRRTVEIVRARMKKLGLIRRISHFNPEFGYRAGWVLSNRFRTALSSLCRKLSEAEDNPGSGIGEQKDRDAFFYV